MGANSPRQRWTLEPRRRHGGDWDWERGRGGVEKGGHRYHTRNPRKHCQVPGREAVTGAVPEVAVYEDAPLRLRLETFV
jgi:hypothetical protein